MQIHPQSASSGAYLISLLLAAGRNQDALQRAHELLACPEKTPDLQLAIAAAYENQRLFDNAISQAQQAFQAAPTYAPAYEAMSRLYLKRSNFERCATVARAGLRFAPFNPDLHFSLGCASLLSGGDVDGRSHLNLAFAIKPAWPEARLALASALISAGHLEAACEQLQDAARLQPTDARIHCQLAMVIDARGLTRDAIAEYDRALQLAPDSVDALNNLAWILATSQQGELRDGSKAVRLAERACALTGYKQAVLIGTLGAAYAEHGDFDKAVETARLASTIARQNDQTNVVQKNNDLERLFLTRKPYRNQQ